MSRAILANQCMLVYTHLIWGTWVASTVWKVFRLMKMNSLMQIPTESPRSILMFHWFWALKPLQYHWVFCACSLNGLCKSTESWAQFPMHTHLFHFPVETRYWRWSPLFWQVAVFNRTYFSAFHLSISLKCESPTVDQCEAVIVSVPFSPKQAGALHVKGSEKEDVRTELIPKLPFVSITLASAAIGQRDTDMWTIDEGWRSPDVF